MNITYSEIAVGDSYKNEKYDVAIKMKDDCKPFSVLRNFLPRYLYTAILCIIQRNTKHK